MKIFNDSCLSCWIVISFTHTLHAVVHTNDGRYLYPVLCEYNSPEFLACIPGVITTTLSLNNTISSCDIDLGFSILESLGVWWQEFVNLTHNI